MDTGRMPGFCVKSINLKQIAVDPEISDFYETAAHLHLKLWDV